MRPYRQARIWAYLREHPGARLIDVRRALDLDEQSAWQAAYRMLRAGTLRREGPPTRRAWYAVGDNPPADGRGLSPVSIHAFADERRKNWKANLQKAYAALGQRVGEVGRVDVAKLNRSCELAKAWRSTVADASIANRDEP